MRSGATPYGSIAHQLPVRPAPHRISSATKSTSCRSQISRIVRKYSGRGVDAPVDEPPTGSAMNAATVSAPASSIACSSAARSEEHTSQLQSLRHLVCRLLLEKKKNKTNRTD